MFDDDDAVEAQPRDRPFDAYRCPRSDNVGSIVADVTNKLQNYEKFLKLRQSKRRLDDQATFEATVSAIMFDLIHHHLIKSNGLVAITRSNQSRGRASRYRPAALERLATRKMEFVDLTVVT